MWRSSFRATRRRLRGYSERNTKGRYVALGTGVAVLGVGYSFFKYQERELGKKLILVLEDLSENARKHHFMIRNGGLHLLLLLAHDPMYCSNELFHAIAKYSAFDDAEQEWLKTDLSLPALLNLQPFLQDPEYRNQSAIIFHRLRQLNLDRLLPMSPTAAENAIQLCDKKHPVETQQFALQLLSRTLQLDPTFLAKKLFEPSTFIAVLSSERTTLEPDEAQLLKLLAQSVATLPDSSSVSSDTLNLMVFKMNTWLHHTDDEIKFKMLDGLASLSQYSPELVQDALPVLLEISRAIHAQFCPELIDPVLSILKILRNLSSSIPFDQWLHTTLESPMANVWKTTTDFADMELCNASDESFLYGWVDILAEWSLILTQDEAKHLSIRTLSNLAQQSSTGQDVLQAWLLHILRFIKSIDRSPDVARAVREVEIAANLEPDHAPASDGSTISSTVMKAGCDALAVLAERHYDNVVWHGGLDLAMLLSRISPELESSCARLVANLAATSCDKLLDNDRSSRTIVPIYDFLKTLSGGKAFLEHLEHHHDDVSLEYQSNAQRALVNMKAFAQLETDGEIPPYYAEGTNVLALDDVKDPTVDIVFVHGLRGHPFSTWRTSMSTDTTTIWPKEWLAQDLKDLGTAPRILTLGYDAGMVTWTCPWPALPLPERAKIMLENLEKAQIGSTRPVVFITHSMGGLLVKEMLVLAAEGGKNHVIKNTAGIVFIAVPHAGGNIGKRANRDAIRRIIQAHPATKDLSADEPHLLQLNEKCKQFSDHMKILSLAEGQAAPIAFGIKGMVVLPSSADPGFGEFHILHSTNHMDICKAPDRNEERYWRILQLISLAIETQ